MNRLATGYRESGAGHRARVAAARKRLALRVATLATFAGFTFYAISPEALDPGLLAREAAGEWHWTILALLSFVLMLLCAATPLPAEAIAIANGVCFGPVAGTLLTWVSAIAGALITFSWSRRLLCDSGALPRGGTRHTGLLRWLQRNGKSGLLLARLVPVVPFFALNFLAALLPVSTREYLLITAIAILPHALLLSALGGYFHGW